MTENIKNKLITRSDIEKIFNKANKQLFDTSINDIYWYQRAFSHKSYSCHHEDQYEELENYGEYKIQQLLPNFESNERLEFLGDSMVDAIVKEYLYDRFEIVDEGFLTKLKIKLVRSERLSEFAEYLGFREFLLLSNKMENLTYKGKNRGRNTKRFLEDSFEAFVGAIMKDHEGCGYEISKKFIVGLIEQLVDFSELIMTNDNYKDSLLRYFQSNKWGNPKYTEISQEGTQSNSVFTMGVFLDDKSLKEANFNNQVKVNNQGMKVVRKMKEQGQSLVALGKGKSKKEAEQMASKWGLTALKVSWNY